MVFVLIIAGECFFVCANRQESRLDGLLYCLEKRSELIELPGNAGEGLAFVVLCIRPFYRPFHV